MWAILVVMAAVDPEHMLEMAAAEVEDSVEAVGTNGSDPALGVGVRVWCLDRRVDHLDALGAENLVEGVGELRGAVVDEESEWLLAAELHDQVARLLSDPAAVRVRAAGEVLDPTCSQRDEEEDVDALKEGGFGGEEVAGEHAHPPRSQEGSPRGSRSLRRRMQTCLVSTLRTEVADTAIP